MRALALLVLVALLSGCTKPEPVPSVDPTRSPGTVIPPASVDPSTPLALVELDGHWDFPIDGARQIAGSARAGAMWAGESRLATGNGKAVAGNVVAFDADASALLGGAPAASRGDVWLSKNASARLGARVGDEIHLTSFSWPRSSILAAFEMERVRPCDANAPAALCLLPARPGGGSAELALVVPPGSSDLMFHADVVELAPRDLPAEWNGSFVAPSGRVAPFDTVARSRVDVDPPGGLSGPVEPGTYTVRFTIKTNGTIAPNAVAGLVTFRTPGYSSFVPDLLRVTDAAQQTQRTLENATRHDATLRVAGTFEPDASDAPGPALARAIAVISPEDAAPLFDVGSGNATALVVPTRAGIASAVLLAAANSDDPSLRQLRVRPARALPPPPASPTLRWAPPEAAVSVESALPLGASLVVADRASVRGAHFLALPTVPAALGSLVARALWPDVTTAYEGIGRGPHLLLLSDDLARAEGLDASNLTYTRVQLDGATGPRTAFAMGAVHGGPAGVIWESAALLGAGGRIVGARWIGPVERAPPSTVEFLSEG